MATKPRSSPTARRWMRTILMIMDIVEMWRRH